MEISIFKEVTTEQALTEIENEAKKYTDLYVDMENDKERKFVKDSADVINKLLKKLDRARIDIKKDFGLEVEKEAKAIRERLESANLPFSTLIDEWKEKRAAILAEKKRKELLHQKELDHAEALEMNELFDFKKEKEARERKERDERIAKEAAAKAEREKEEAEERADQMEREKLIAEAKHKKELEEAERKAKAEALAKEAEEEKKRAANREHMGKICGEAKISLMEIFDLEEDLAKAIVTAIAKGEVKNAKIVF